MRGVDLRSLNEISHGEEYILLRKEHRKEDGRRREAASIYQMTSLDYFFNKFLECKNNFFWSAHYIKYQDPLENTIMNRT